MTPAQLDIARRLVASSWGRLPPQNDGKPGDAVLDTDGVRWLFVPEPGYEDIGAGDWLPDLTDAGTGGVLLGMLADAVPALDVGYTGDGWWTRAWMGADWGPTCSGSTLAVVAASALLEVRGG